MSPLSHPRVQQPFTSSVSITLADLVLTTNLLRVYSIPLSKLLMKTLNQMGPSEMGILGVLDTFSFFFPKASKTGFTQLQKMPSFEDGY